MNPAILLAASMRSGHIGYCTTCRRENVKIVNSDVVNMTTECEECYLELTSRDRIREDKDKRAEEVRKYFATRKKREEV